jgi:hypothetical protein
VKLHSIIFDILPKGCVLLLQFILLLLPHYMFLQSRFLRNIFGCVVIASLFFGFNFQAQAIDSRSGGDIPSGDNSSFFQRRYLLINNCIQTTTGGILTEISGLADPAEATPKFLNSRCSSLGAFSPTESNFSSVESQIHDIYKGNILSIAACYQYPNSVVRASVGNLQNANVCVESTRPAVEGVRYFDLRQLGVGNYANIYLMNCTARTSPTGNAFDTIQRISDQNSTNSKCDLDPYRKDYTYSSHSTFYFWNYPTQIRDIYIDPTWQKITDKTMVADFNNDSVDDDVYRNITTGEVRVYLNQRAKQYAYFTQAKEYFSLYNVTDQNWQIKGFGDIDGDNSQDIIWSYKNTNTHVVWYLNNGAWPAPRGEVITNGNCLKGFSCGAIVENGIVDINGYSFRLSRCNSWYCGKTTPSCSGSSCNPNISNVCFVLTTVSGKPLPPISSVVYLNKIDGTNNQIKVERSRVVDSKNVLGDTSSEFNNTCQDYNSRDSQFIVGLKLR